VPVGLIALTKADLVDAETLELVRLEVCELVAGSFLQTAPIVPVSSRTGLGLDAFRAALADAARNVRGRPAGGATRLPIDRVFSMKGFGTVVTGTLVSGRLRVDAELAIVPGPTSSGGQGRPVKVRGIQVHGVRRDEAIAGQRSAVNLGGVEVEDIERGQSAVTPGAFETTRLADAVLELLPDAKPLKHGARVRFHQGTAEILGRVAIIGPPDGGPERPALHVRPGARAFVRLRLERPAVLTRGDRYIIRAYSPPITIAGGQILDPRPPRTAIRTNAALERCRRLDLDHPDADLHAVNVMIQGAGMAGLPLDALVSRAGLEPAAIDALAARCAAVRVGAVLVTPAVFERLSSTIVDLLGTHHAAQPLSDGIPREEARERLFAHGHPAVFEKALEELTTRGTIVGRDRLALASHRVSLSPDEERARAAIERAFREAALKPPDPATVASEAGVPAAVADRVFKLLQRQKVLVKVDALLFHHEALKRLKEDVAALKRSGADARLDVATFKERFGVTRKFAIPLLEYLDRERVTRRVGDARVVL
jgi:selenocysteine-specific elongation factor